MSSIKTNFELPRGDDPVKQAQRLSQDLSSNFKGVVSLIDAANQSTKSLQNQVDSLPGAISIGFTKGQFINFSSSGTVSVVLSHSLGVTPTGWWIADSIGSLSAVPSFKRVAWDATTIQIESSAFFGTINGKVYVVA